MTNCAFSGHEKVNVDDAFNASQKVWHPANITGRKAFLIVKSLWQNLLEHSIVVLPYHTDIQYCCSSASLLEASCPHKHMLNISFTFLWLPYLSWKMTCK